MTQPRKYRAILTVLLALAAPTGWTEYDAFKLGEGAGSYLYSVAILSVLHASECGYLIKRVPDYNAVVSEVASSFRDSDREKLSALARDPNFFQEAEDFLQATISDFRNRGLNLDARCSAALGVMSSMYEAGQERWQAAHELYSR